MTSVMRGPVIHENMVVWCRRRMANAGRRCGRRCRTECLGVCVAWRRWGLFGGCLPPQTRAAKQVGERGSERKKERKKGRRRSTGHCREMRRQSSPVASSAVVDFFLSASSRLVGLVAHGAAGTAGAGVRTRRALVNHSGAMLAYPTATFTSVCWRRAFTLSFSSLCLVLPQIHIRYVCSVGQQLRLLVFRHPSSSRGGTSN